MTQSVLTIRLFKGYGGYTAKFSLQSNYIIVKLISSGEMKFNAHPTQLRSFWRMQIQETTYFKHK